MRSKFTFGILGLALVVLFGISNPGTGISADMPAGFACLGSVLPDDMGMLREVPKLIEQYKLTEYAYPELKAQEKWGVEVTPQDQERGYIVFSRHYLDNVYYFSVPNNRIDKLSIFASPDEYEPITFAVYGLKDIKGFKVSVSDLKDGKGNIIRKDNVDVRAVRSLPFIKNEKEYDLEPILLEKPQTVDVSAKKSTWFWFTAYVPKSGKPGTYAGTISLTAPETKPYKIKLSVKVLPIKLQEPDVLNGMCFLIPGRKDLYPENLSKYFADLKAHGMNSMWTWPDFEVKKVDGKLVCDFSKFGVTRKDLNYFGNSLDEMLAGYQKAGFNKLWIAGSADTFGGMIEQATGAKQMTPEFDQAYVELARQFIAEGKKKHWPPFAWHVVDEASKEGPLKYAIYYNKLLKDNFPNVKTFADVGPWNKEDEALFPYIDIMTYACQKKENVENCLKAGDAFWIYNHGGWGRFNKSDRMTRGIYTWKTGAKGNFDWVYTWWIEPKVPPSWHPSFVYVVPAPDGPLPTVAWEGIREGVDDLRYIYTLDRLIQKAKTSGSERLKVEAAKAEADLNDIMKDVPFEWLDRGTYLEKTPSVNFDLNRWKVAEDIIRLEKVTSGKPVSKADKD